MAELQAGISVQVFSSSCQTWVAGTVTRIGENHIDVDYVKQGRLHRKKLHTCSSQVRTRSLQDKSVQTIAQQECEEAPSRAERFKNNVEQEGLTQKREASKPQFPESMRDEADRKIPDECDIHPEKWYLEMDYIIWLVEEGMYKLIDAKWLILQSKDQLKDLVANSVRKNDNESPFLAFVKQCSALRDLQQNMWSSAESWPEVDKALDAALDDWKPLPACQDLPEQASTKLSEIQAVIADDDDHVLSLSPIVSISHCWLNRNHPDPEGKLLDQIAARIFLRNHHRPREWKARNFSGAFFFAWCSMYQPYHKKDQNGRYTRLDAQDLSEDRRHSFKRSLQYMHIWYSHKRIEKWLYTQPLTSTDSLCLPYHDRGWPTWEYAISQLLSDPNSVVDTRDDRYYPPFRLYQWDDVVDDMKKRGRVNRDAPYDPDEFQEIIASKKFTMHTDLKIVEENYRRNFNSTTSCIISLEFRKMNWSPQQLKRACQVLKFCKNLQDLDLGENKLDSECVGILSKGLLDCGELRVLHLDDVALNGDSCKKLVVGLSKCQKLKTLNLCENEVGEEGAYAILEVIESCVDLEELLMFRNKIGDAGAGAIVNALGSCKHFRLFDLGSNDLFVPALGNLACCCSLRELILDDNRFADDYAQSIVQTLLGCCQLSQCDLSGNAFGQAALRNIHEMLKGHKSLHVFLCESEPVRLRMSRESQAATPPTKDVFEKDVFEGLFGDECMFFYDHRFSLYSF